MSRIHNKDTAPELFLRKALWHAGIRYKKNYKELPGKPDIYVSKYKTAIFMHGCFWHQHQGCLEASRPKTNSKFWTEKLRKNCERDQKIMKSLIELGIRVIVVWECTVDRMRKDEIYKAYLVTGILNAMKNGEDMFYEFFRN